ncbi:hypothetical protein L2E82_12182 [Cichorium intybus]|uniref:Uncharacterized protein n=1 Tax=Cichorium intybus TaxID=13427 RepID=A0ACB9GFD7_CICIN|nr:hypothetical protein L2E82_12182 [Cichorium intybus]
MVNCPSQFSSLVLSFNLTFLILPEADSGITESFCPGHLGVDRNINLDLLYGLKMKIETPTCDTLFISLSFSIKQVRLSLC